ncbi:MAG: hypothetical protein RQ748_09165, partial [Elusimicrobiales bacterium]|nr:hypothetical protein [Elusimicrobiales bacterium]
MKRFILGVIAYFIFAGSAFAAAPEVMTYQGRLKENGLPVTGNRDITMKLCDDPFGGNCYVEPAAQSVYVSTGLFKSTFTLPSGADLSAPNDWYLQVEVNGTNLWPREKFTAVPYAILASSAVHASTASYAAALAVDSGFGVHSSTHIIISGGLVASDWSTAVSTVAALEGTVRVQDLSAGQDFRVGVVGRGVSNSTDPDDVAVGASFEGEVPSEMGGMPLALRAAVRNDGASTPQAITLMVDALENTGSIGMTYGIFIATMTGGTQTVPPYALYSEDPGARTYFAGNVGISSAVPAYALSVSSGAGEAGTIMAVSTGTTNLFWVAGDGAHATRFFGDGSGLTGATGTDNTKVLKTGDTMTGQLTTLSTITVQGDAFSVGGSTLVVEAGQVGIGTGLPASKFEVANGSISITGTEGGLLFDGEERKLSPTTDASVGGGIAFSTNVYVVGFSSAAKYYGDGSALTGIGTGSLEGTLSVDSGGTGADLSAAGGANQFVRQNSIGGVFTVSAIADADVPDAITIDGTGNVTWASVSKTGSSVADLATRDITDLTGTLPIGNGGTGATDAPTALSNLGAAGLADNTFTGAQTYAAGASLAAALNQPGVRVSTAIFVGTGADISTITPAGFFGNYSGSGANLTNLNGTQVGAGVPAANIADGALGVNVLVSSLAAASVYEGAFLSPKVNRSGDTMEGTLDMGGNFISGVSTITMLNGSIAVVPPGTGGTNIGYGISIGSAAYNNYTNGIGIGYGAYGNYTGGVGLGTDARTNYMYGIGVGNGAFNNYSFGVGIGNNTSANWTYGVGVGAGASGNRNYGVGIGAYSVNNKDYAVGVGAHTQQIKGYGAALGAYSYASSSATALGAQAKANAELSMALGYGTVNDSTGTASFGSYAMHTSTAVDAAYYQINGSTVLAVLPAASSIGVGPLAGASNTSGAYNVFVGRGAGTSNTTTTNNTMVGYAAGTLNTGAANTFLGSYAGDSSTTGGSNIVIGFLQDTSAPGVSNELNVGGVLFGQLGFKTIGISTRAPQAALDIVSTGTAHTEMAQLWRDSTGLIVGSMSVTGSMQAVRFVGDGSGLSGVTGATGNDPDALQLAGGTMLGAIDMDGNFLSGVSTITMLNGSIAIVPPGTGGSNNAYGISIGSNSYNNYTYGVGVGNGAYGNYLYGVGMGNLAYGNSSYGVGLGYGAYGNYSQGVGIGSSASNNYSSGVGLGSNASGNANYAVGIGAFSQNNRPYGAALGAYSFAATSATALGSYAKSNAYASIAIGAGTVNNSTGTASFGAYKVNAPAYWIDGSTVVVLFGNSSMAVGPMAGAVNAGNYNLFVGSAAGAAVTGSFNTMIGYGAGFQSVATERNTFIGSAAGSLNVTGGNNIVIGESQNTSDTNADFELNIGGLLFGKLDDKVIGISTRAPQAALDIVSTGTASNVYAQVWRDSDGVARASVTANGVFYGDGSGLTG